MSTPQVRPLRAVSDDPTKYTEFDRAFERALVYASCVVPRFWGLIGMHLDPECLRDDRGVELLKACAAIARETGEGPTSPTLVLQRLMAAVDSGRLTQRQVDHAAELFDMVEDAGVPHTDQLVTEAAKVLRARANADILRRMSLDHGKGKSLVKYAAEIDTAERIGKEVATGSTLLSKSVWAGIDELRRTDRLPLGIPQLDDPMGGGIHPRTLTVIGADMGVGKTATLVHVGCFAWMAGKRVIYVPTEEGVSETLVRAIAWVTGESMRAVERSDHAAKDKLDRMLAHPKVGALAVEYLPQGSTPNQLRQLVAQAVEDHPAFGGGYDVLIVDYADKLSSGRSGLSSYEEMKVVYEGVRQIAVDDRTWAVTGSQLKDLDGKKIPGADDLSDSRWKGRTADTVITIWKPADGDPEDRHYHIAKNRGPGAGTLVGPLPMDMDRGRMVPLGAGLTDDSL